MYEWGKLSSHFKSWQLTYSHGPCKKSFVGTSVTPLCFDIVRGGQQCGDPPPRPSKHASLNLWQKTPRLYLTCESLSTSAWLNQTRELHNSKLTSRWTIWWYLAVCRAPLQLFWISQIYKRGQRLIATDWKQKVSCVESFKRLAAVLDVDVAMCYQMTERSDQSEDKLFMAD